jgi:hypothetical protein
MSGQWNTPEPADAATRTSTALAVDDSLLTHHSPLATPREFLFARSSSTTSFTLFVRRSRTKSASSCSPT